MENCFADIIGYKGKCSTTASTSGLYVNDIGITSDECDMYINSPYRNGDELIADKISFASNIVRKTISNNFASYINNKTLIDSKVIGRYNDNLELKSGTANTFAGINLQLTNYESYYDVFISAISLQISVPQTVNVFAYNLITGELLDTFALSCEANKITTKYINKTYSANKRRLDLIFVYDTEGLSANTCTLDYTGCTSCSGYTLSNGFLAITPVTIGEADAKIRTSLTTATHTYGLSLNYSLQCSQENWLCDMSNLMALPILYKVGIEIMQYALYYTDRQNSDTNIDWERNKERMEAYQSEYEKALNATVKKINIPKYDRCFKCEEYVKHSIVLP